MQETTITITFEKVFHYFTLCLVSRILKYFQSSKVKCIYRSLFHPLHFAVRERRCRTVHSGTLTSFDKNRLSSIEVSMTRKTQREDARRVWVGEEEVSTTE